VFDQCLTSCKFSTVIESPSTTPNDHMHNTNNVPALLEMSRLCGIHVNLFECWSSSAYSFSIQFLVLRLLSVALRIQFWQLAIYIPLDNRLKIQDTLVDYGREANANHRGCHGSHVSILFLVRNILQFAPVNDSVG
jgi:hypothetical protein